MTIADFEKMVDMALADGVLTPEEQKVLLYRATELKLSPEELQMIIDARLFERNKREEERASKTTAQTAPPASMKNGGIKKCPACGSHISGFSTKCPECGHEFSGVAAVSSANSLFEKMQECSRKASKEMSEFESRKNSRLQELADKHNKATIELTNRQNSGGAVSKLMSSSSAKKQERDDLTEKQNAERRALIQELEKSRYTLEKNLLEEKRQIIKNFPVPNTKEDLMELLAMASSNAYDNDGVIGPEEEVWIQKTDQIYSKIKSLANDDKPFLDEATNVVISLMTRLPKNYKQFTVVPDDYMYQMKEQLQASRNRKKEAKKQAFQDAFMEYKIIYMIGIAVFVIGVIWDLIDYEIGFGTLLWMGSLVLIMILGNKSLQGYKEDLKTIDPY